MITRPELFHLGLMIFGGAVGILLIGLLVAGDVGLVLGFAALLGFAARGLILSLAVWMRR